MQKLPLVFVAVMATAAAVHSQDEGTVDSGGPVVAPAAPRAPSVVKPTTARILGNIPDGTPPPPQPPKPVFIVPARDFLATTTHKQGGRTITIRKIKPLALPPPPPPPPPMETSAAEVDAEFSQQLAGYREEHPKSGLLFLGATVFRSKDSPPRTLVRYWPEGGREDITLWTSADFALIAGGINSFVDAAADTHYLLMGWGNVDIDRMTELRAAKGLEYDAPDMPDFPEGEATFQIVGKQPTSEDLVPIQALHELYNSEFNQLKTAWEGRERARIEREAYLKANPPQPKNIVINYWRTDKPAPAKGAAK